MNYREWQELEDERGGEDGDPRRCPVHGCGAWSPGGGGAAGPDGMHDAPCGQCKSESEAACEDEQPPCGDGCCVHTEPERLVQEKFPAVEPGGEGLPF